MTIPTYDLRTHPDLTSEKAQALSTPTAAPSVTGLTGSPLITSHDGTTTGGVGGASWIDDVGGTIRKAGGAITSPITAPVEAVTGGLEQVTSIWETITDKSFWLRIAFIIVGITIVLIGVSRLTDGPLVSAPPQPESPPLEPQGTTPTTPSQAGRRTSPTPSQAGRKATRKEASKQTEAKIAEGAAA